ncbi:hypothetical protein PR202_gb08081 [Eleusine coracana subsp. coracana]|uniref:Protein kinase domain-containing protein n=1 Tax=Eleusine coracana subsp. coracana TaxID=191504 RepID=A0AAV5EE89_ELECO|nr:hypothetical protein PR202_gb08081 [Eleusine coracana subsp. coracana]
MHRGCLSCRGHLRHDRASSRRRDTPKLEPSRYNLVHDQRRRRYQGAAAEDRKKKKRCMISVGSYEDEGVVGEGRFGVVFRARHRGTGQDTAVKSYRSDYDDGIKDDGAPIMAATPS